MFSVWDLIPSWRALKVILTINGIIGFLLFYQAWKRTEKMRTVDKERDAIYHSSVRTDWPRWSFWKTLPIAVTILPARLCLAFVGLFGSGIAVG